MSKNNTKKIKCTCKHSDQDEMHGKGIRVANRTNKTKGSTDYYYRCTVCCREV